MGVGSLQSSTACSVARADYPRAPRRIALRDQQGYSLLELAFVIALLLIMSAVALIQVQSSQENAKAEAALQITLGQIRQTHEMSIDLRRIYRLSFVAPATLQADLVTLDASGNRTFSFASSIDLPQGTQFAAVSGIPRGAGATPDGLGSGANAIDFAVDYGGGGTELYFQPDGRVLDSVNRSNSGVVYVARAGDVMSSRAVSVLGATGRAKAWRLVRNANQTVSWRQ